MKDLIYALQHDRDFKKNLMITKAWCKYHMDKVGSIDYFRPIELTPKIDMRDLCVSSVLKVKEIDRLNSVKVGLMEGAECFESISGGKICIFYTYLSLNDAIMESESLGFIDDDDIPPWGTWFYFLPESDDNIGGALFSWIPDHFVPLVDSALEVDQYECLVWM